MTDVAELLEQVAEQARAQARPPALAVLRRRRARRTATRAGTGLTVLAAAAAVLVPWGPAPVEDVVVADPAPSGSPTPAVPAGQVALPGWVASELGLPAGAPAPDLLSSHVTEDGPLVTAARRDGDRLCWAVFTAGPAGAPAGGASCDRVDLPAYRSGSLDLGAASEGPSGGGPVTWLVLRGSAPAGTRTVVVTAAGGASERIAVTGGGAPYLDRAWFALPWVQQDTVVEALDAGGRTLDRSELLLGMGQPSPGA